MPARSKKGLPTASSDRADAGKELAALVRAAQGTGRCVYKTGREPAWWPEHLPFVAAAKLRPSQVDEALRAAKGAGGGDLAASGEEDAVRGEDGATVGERTGGAVGKTCAMDEEDVAEKVEEGGEGGEVCGDRRAADAVSRVDAGAARTEFAKAEDSDALFGEGADVSDEEAGSSGADGDQKDSGEDGGKECTKGEGCMPPPPTRRPPLSRAAAPERGRGELFCEAPVLSLHESGLAEACLAGGRIPTDEELDALVEDAERITQAALEEIAITRALHKRSMLALLKSCCDDIMEKAQLINQRMPTHVRLMPAEEYVLQHGGDPGSVMEHEIYQRWSAQLASLTGGAATAEAGAGANVENISPRRGLANGKSKIRERAALAATTARKMTAPPPVETPGTLRRSARNGGASGAVAGAEPAHALRRRERGAGAATAARIASRAETERFRRRGGVVKPGRARAPRDTDVLLPHGITTNGSPVELGIGALVQPPSPGAKGHGGEEDDEKSLVSKLAAHRREVEALQKRLAQARRNGGVATGRKRPLRG